MSAFNCIKLYISISLLLIVYTNAHYARNRRQTLITASNVYTPLSKSTAESLIDNEKLNKRPSYKEYLDQRQKFIEEEFSVGFEHDVQLNEQEQLANEVIKAAKAKEVNEGFRQPFRFNPSRHLFDVLKDIRKSELFQILQKMPKGGILHAHDMALCSTDYIVTLTYLADLWQCSDPNASHRIQQFLFSRNAPATVSGCEWLRVSEVRTKIGASKYDRYVRTLFTLYREDENPRTQFKDINDVWNTFMDIFLLIGPIVTYAPVWKDYYKNALKEMYADNVQYLEFRGLLPQLYDLDGKVYDEEEVMQIYVDALQEFQVANPGFIGSKFIYAPLKNAPNSTTDRYFEVVQRLHKRFPNYLAGFDLVGQEDTSKNIFEFVERLLDLPEDINLFLHAGETNWFGSVDDNMIDAILLGSKRIGHGYALAKHPKLLELVKERDIAIEVNPVSNQVLKLVDDQRNHPATVFFSQNIPIVISSDDPSFWEATPLSHDFYAAFLGITTATSDLRTLKKLAKNSIKYSSLNATEKDIAYEKWQDKWDEFIQSLIQDGNSASQPA